MLVSSTGAQSREDVVAHELRAQIFDERLGRPDGRALLGGGFQVLALPHVREHRDNLAVVVLFQPRDDDGGVEPSRIR